MSAGVKNHKGFTLVEALVAVIILTVGIVSTMSALGALSHSEAYAREKEKMVRLASMKYEELVATGEATNAMASGDFLDDYQIDGYSWESNLEPSGVENLSGLTVTVTKDQRPLNGLTEKVEGLVFIPPVTTTEAGATTP